MDATWQNATTIFLLGVLASVVVYDIIARIFGGPQATITSVVQSWQETFPELAYVAAAVMCGLWLHFFFKGIVGPNVH